MKLEVKCVKIAGARDTCEAPLSSNLLDFFSSLQPSVPKILPPIMESLKLSPLIFVPIDLFNYHPQPCWHCCISAFPLQIVLPLFSLHFL
jgi:hypothetical protein